MILILMAVVALSSGEDMINSDENLVSNATAKSIPIPEPVDVSHGFKLADSDASTVRGPRIEIDHDGVPIVHGVVMPDDPNDKQIWRNARVLNNKLIENKNNAPAAAVAAEDARHGEEGSMFVYRPQMGRILDSENTRDFKPSQSDPSLTQSLPYPAYYYQRYYQDKESQEPQLADTLAVESQTPQVASVDAAAVTTSTDDAPSDVVIGDVSDSELDDSSAVTAATLDDTDGRGFNLKKKNTGFNKKTPGSSYGSGIGRPISPVTYYVQPEEAKSIHDDRSPYDYEPAQQTPQYYTNDAYIAAQQQPTDFQYYTQQQQQEQKQQITPERSGYYQQNGYLSSGNVVPAPNDAFIIRDQTYHNGGQSFSVPVPVPKDQHQYIQQQYPYQYQYGYQQQPASGQQNYYYQQQRPQQPSVQPLDFLSLKFKEQVQKAKDKYHEMTDPVVDPLMEAGQKISTNLGLPERVHKINEKVATPSVLVPLAMAAGGVLALGGLSTAIALHHDNRTQTTLKSLGLKTSPLAERITTLLEKNKPSEIIKVKRSVDEVYDEDKENLLDRVLSSLNGPQKAFLAQLQQTGFDQWQRTSCAKRIFCDVMVQQNDDTVAFMEKRMGTFLTLLDSGMAQNLQALTDDVMDGIRRRNCQAFACAKQSETDQQ